MREALPIILHPHAEQRLKERGATREEAEATIYYGEASPAKFNRHCFRRNFVYQGEWNGKSYSTKQLEVFAVEENGGWLALTVIVKYF